MIREMILGTDWDTDCDDVTAVRLITYYHRTNRIKLLGINIDSCKELSAPSLDSFLKLCHSEIPFGLDHEANDYPGDPTYQKYFAEQVPGTFRRNEETEDSVPFYRRLLASAERSAELLEIGFSQSMSALLQSPPDEISPLSGMELVKRKVSHLWSMAGKWSEQDGKEWNFAATRRSSEAAALLCEKWPTPITFLGWEVGASVVSGKHLEEDDPLRYAMVAFGTDKGRMSWDPMLVQLAAAGSPEKAGYSVVRGKASVDPETGRNRFREDPAGPHEYVVKIHPDSWYEDRLESDLKEAYLDWKKTFR